jgi:NADP-dependent 3-hydroxy acid dehydrogenase YdfG
MELPLPAGQQVVADLKQLAQSVGRGAAAIEMLQLDVSSAGSMQRMVADVKAKYNQRIDLLVSAGCWVHDSLWGCRLSEPARPLEDAGAGLGMCAWRGRPWPPSSARVPALCPPRPPAR